MDMSRRSDELPYRIAEMHEKSTSPTGKFGFHIATCVGTLPQNNRWQDSWEVFFLQNMRNKFKLADEVQGEDPEVTQLRAVIVSKAIAHSLRPPEIEGRKLKPSLVQGVCGRAIPARTSRPINPPYSMPLAIMHTMKVSLAHTLVPELLLTAPQTTLKQSVSPNYQ